LFTVRSWKDEVFTASIAATDIPLDDRDLDGDGLHNSWERSFGSDPGNSDTDGDGMTDASEVLVASDPLDAESYLAVSGVRRAPNGTLLVYWDSVDGLTYRVEYAPCCPVMGEPCFNDLGSATATGRHTEFPVAATPDDRCGYYRVLVRKQP
jgi:hypothetical protein